MSSRKDSEENMSKLHLGTSRDNKKEEIVLPLDSLKRHFAALGASGSGKTVLVKVLLEECIRNEVPTIIVDIQGDLASLAMVADKKEVQSKGVPGSYVDDYRKKAEIAIFTPASTKGIPISMNPLRAPSLDMDPEDLIQATDVIASSVATILNYNPQKGKGKEVKDYLYLVLKQVWGNGIEVNSFGELANIVTDDSQFVDESTVLMIDDKAKNALIKAIKGMTVGANSLIFSLGMPLEIERLISWGDEGKTPVSILYLNTIRSQKDRQSFIATLANETYSWMLKNPTTELQLIFLLDELAGLMPPVQNPPTKQGLLLLMKQARKYGVSVFLATQNISDVDYKSLSQVGTWALGRILAKQDLNKVEQIIQAISPLEANEIIQQLPKLNAGQFMLLAPDVYEKVQRLQCRWLLTIHKTIDDEGVRALMDESGLRDRFPTGDNLVSGRKSTTTVDKLRGDAFDGSTYEEALDEDGLPLPEPEEDEDLELIDGLAENLHVADFGASVEQLLEKTGSAFSAAEISQLIGKEEGEVSQELEKLAETGRIKNQAYEGEEDEMLYWNAKYNIDLGKHIVGPLYRVHLEITRGKALEIMKKNIPKTLGIRKLEEIAKDSTSLFYIPLWRIGAKYRTKVKKGRRKKQMVNRTKLFYINALSSKLTIFIIEKKKNIMRWSASPKIGIEKLGTLPPDVILDEEEISELGKYDILPKIPRVKAKQQLVEMVGARINKQLIPALCWYPIWEFRLKDKDTGKIRHSWIDALYGTYIEKTPIE